MSDFQINDYILHKECTELAKDIFDEVMADADDDEDAEHNRETMMDRAHEVADGHQWVIYNYQALKLCAECNTNYGDQLLEDIGMPNDPTLYKLACTIAYGEMRGRIEEAITDLIDEYDEAE